jgi:serine/threonine protein phosphatase PrpC
VRIVWEAAGETDRGRVRKTNEDAIRLDSKRGIFLVADGMGGHAAGEVASALAADACLEALSAGPITNSEGLAPAFALAHDRIVDCCNDDPRVAGMGTTLTLVVLDDDGRAHIGHIGDSRLYQLSGESLRQLTRDHTWVQREIDAGRVKPEAARTHHLSHILTRVLSADEPPVPDLFSANVAPGDVLLLCSDGLHNMLDAHDILTLLLESESAGEAAESLVKAANASGGADNISVVVVRALRGD